jgi:hypothetical protein
MNKNVVHPSPENAQLLAMNFAPDLLSFMSQCG